MSDKTIFQRIMAGEIPANKLYEDDLAVVIADIQPQAPVHLLIIPRKPIARIAAADRSDQAILGHLLLLAAKMAAQQDLNNGFRIIINNGSDGGETVPHLHVHLMGGRPMQWPPG